MYTSSYSWEFASKQTATFLQNPIISPDGRSSIWEMSTVNTCCTDGSRQKFQQVPIAIAILHDDMVSRESISDT
jgi:hypothetical protein